MPLNFVAVDFETANFDRASVCAVGLTRVADGVADPSMAFYVAPPTGPAFTNSHIHGIEARHVEGAISWSAALDRIAAITGGFPLVAYSSFDKGVFNAANSLTGEADRGLRFLDALVLVKRHYGFASNRLPAVAAEFGIPSFEHHDAGEDAAACAHITLRIAADRSADSVDALWGDGSTTVARGGAGGTARKQYTKKAELPQPSPVADPEHPLFGEVVCFSGDLESYGRAEAQEIVASFGASVSGNVTKKTTLVVMGGFDPATLRPGASLSTKVQRAQELAAKGQQVEVVTEQTFLEILSST